MKLSNTLIFCLAWGVIVGFMFELAMSLDGLKWDLNLTLTAWIMWVSGCLIFVHLVNQKNHDND